MESTDKHKHFENAIHYVSAQIAQGKKSNDQGLPLNRGDLLLLVMLLEQEMTASPADLKRLTAIRGKLGDLVFDAPQMSKEEAKIIPHSTMWADKWPERSAIGTCLTAAAVRVAVGGGPVFFVRRLE